MMTYHFYFIFPYENYFSLTTQNPKGKTFVISEIENNLYRKCEFQMLNQPLFQKSAIFILNIKNFKEKDIILLFLKLFWSTV